MVTTATQHYCKMILTLKSLQISIHYIVLTLANIIRSVNLVLHSSLTLNKNPEMLDFLHLRQYLTSNPERKVHSWTGTEFVLLLQPRLPSNIQCLDTFLVVYLWNPAATELLNYDSNFSSNFGWTHPKVSILFYLHGRHSGGLKYSLHCLMRHLWFVPSIQYSLASFTIQFHEITAQTSLALSFHGSFIDHRWSQPVRAHIYTLTKESSSTEQKEAWSRFQLTWSGPQCIYMYDRHLPRIKLDKQNYLLLATLLNIFN